MFEIINQLGAISQFVCGERGVRKVGALVNYLCGYFFFLLTAQRKFTILVFMNFTKHPNF